MAHSSSHLLKTVFGCALLQAGLRFGGTEDGNNVDLSYSRGNRECKKDETERYKSSYQVTLVISHRWGLQSSERTSHLVGGEK